MFVLRYRLHGEQPQERVLSDTYDSYEDLSAIVNNAVEKKVELVLLPNEGELIRIDTMRISTMSVADPSVKRLM